MIDILAYYHVLELEWKVTELLSFLVIIEIFIWAKQIAVAGNVEVLVTSIIQTTLFAFYAEV